MRRILRLLAPVLLAAVPALPFGRARQISEIDRYCKSVDMAVSTATPFLFTGPDPWSEADDLSPDDQEEAVAYVYAVGLQIRRVFIRITDAEDGWREDVSYFFDPGGDLVKRIRTVDSPAANISLETTAYYTAGDLLKESAHRHSLAHGRQDSSRFLDPGAPVFWTTDDLPFSDILDLWRGLI
jgi:hypothetical protein